jgi:cold shock CspA family protein
MQKPLELTFRDVEKSPHIEGYIRRKVDRLEKFCDNIIGARVLVERPHKAHETAGPRYRVKIDLTVPPGHEIVVTKDGTSPDLNDDLRTVLNRTFQAAERELKQLVKRRRRDVKARTEPRALIARLFRDDGYGFLRTPEGREIYFHRNAVTHGDYDRLAIGTEVRFAETMGQKGAQATTVQIVSKPGRRVQEE